MLVGHVVKGNENNYTQILDNFGNRLSLYYFSFNSVSFTFKILASGSTVRSNTGDIETMKDIYNMVLSSIFCKFSQGFSLTYFMQLVSPF